MVQFITTYQHSAGQKRVRVTTLARKYVLSLLRNNSTMIKTNHSQLIPCP